MTKQEKIQALKNSIREEFDNFQDTPELAPEELKSLDWLAFRVECEQRQEAEQMRDYIAHRVAYKIFEVSQFESGEYEAFFLIKRKGDFDKSEEAEARRKRTDEFTAEMNKKMKKELAKIELEHPDE